MSVEQDVQEMRNDRDVEFLGSIYLQGKLHAAFPTARRTLCGIRCVPIGELMLDQPNCVVCRETIGRMRYLRCTGIPRRWISIPMVIVEEE